MTEHVIHMPCDEAKIRELRIGDTVLLQDTLFGIRDATQIHMFDKGRLPGAIEFGRPGTGSNHSMPLFIITPDVGSTTLLPNTDSSV